MNLEKINELTAQDMAGVNAAILGQQNIDIHFNFIGSYYPPVETVSEGG